MKRKNFSVKAAAEAVLFFLAISATVTVAVLSYAWIDGAVNGDNRAVAGIMFAVVCALAVIATAANCVRRKFTVERPVKKILSATDAIAAGDFSVRLDVTHTLADFDEYDCIMDNLNKMAAELSRTEVLHTDFVSNVSHEIKTPLSVIQNYAMLLQDARLGAAERKKYLNTIVSATKRLTDLVVNILKLNKLENQKLRAEEAEINLTEQLAQTVLGYEDVMEQKGVALDCDLDEVTVVCPAGYLETVWNNLLSNAVKFTERGGKITVSLKAADGKAAVKVADTGCGISPDTGAHIFEKFYQGDASRAQEGNGLGLALVKKVIDIVGGNISVNSEVGKGTEFTVTLNGVKKGE